MYKGNNEDWSKVKGYLEAALEYSDGLSSIEDVRDMLAENRADLWVGEKSAIVTQALNGRGKRALLYYLAGGDLKELKKMTNSIERLAKEAGCSKVLINGRAGWGKALGGYKERTRVFEKEL
tara:strand:+ start:720 stop:1085 length:366 start_codon:yes stop_codon:yes gene_type:complete